MRQETHFPDRSTVREYLDLFASFYPCSRSIEDLLAQVALLFLDEPTTDLDPQSRCQIWEVVQVFVASGGAVMLIAHAMTKPSGSASPVRVTSGRVVHTGGSE